MLPGAMVSFVTITAWPLPVIIAVKAMQMVPLNLLRDSCDFASVSAYEDFLAAIVRDINARKKDKVEEERSHLQPLPLQRTADYTEQVVRVSTSSTIQVKRVVYTVPSRLIGEALRGHIYDSRLQVYRGAIHTVTQGPAGGLPSCYRQP